jgi:5-methylcytosine-specific restriction endonuclease McrA
MKRVLLLNSDWSPLNFVSGYRALNLLFKGRAEVINMGDKPSVWDDALTTPTRSYEVPATLRLVQRVNKRYTSPRFRKWVLFNRDAWQCQYCGIGLDRPNITIDHIVPRSRGGLTSWKNCVASCKKCNMKKGSRTLAESGMCLRKTPAEPKVTHFLEPKVANSWHPDWSNFFTLDTYR